MPYINQQDRYYWHDVLDNLLYKIQFGEQCTSGELNYIITNILKAYLNRKGLSYTTLNEINGTLDSVSKEFYRRVTAPYEDRKRKENGDVF